MTTDRECSSSINYTEHINLISKTRSKIRKGHEMHNQSVSFQTNLSNHVKLPSIVAQSEIFRERFILVIRREFSMSKLQIHCAYSYIIFNKNIEGAPF